MRTAGMKVVNYFLLEDIQYIPYIFLSFHLSCTVFLVYLRMQHLCLERSFTSNHKYILLLLPAVTFIHLDWFGVSWVLEIWAWQYLSSPKYNETRWQIYVSKNLTAIFLSRNHDPVTQDNPQTAEIIYWAALVLSYSLKNSAIYIKPI